MNRRGIKRTIKITTLAIIIIIVLGYGIFATHDFVSGPEIIMLKPENGITVNIPEIEISGIAKRIKEITLNDRPITIDEEGNWNETSLLAIGYNVFSIKAYDRFNRKKEYRLELIYKVD